jgi:putative ABC transport system permease protein
VGIGASVAMFSVLYGVLLRPLPVQDQQEIIVLWTEAPARGSVPLPVTHADLVAFAEQTRAFESVAGVAYQGALEQVFFDEGVPVSLSGTWVTGDFFRVLGVQPVHGRTLLPTDDASGAPPVVVIGHAFWQRHFGGDPAAVGYGLERDGEMYTVVGVLPPGFEYPRGADIWLPVLRDFPATAEPGGAPSETMVFNLIGRLRSDRSQVHAAEDYGRFLRATDAQRPEAMREMQPSVTPLPELLTGDVRGPLLIVASAVGLLLLIACVNVANLLLVRGSGRSRELGIRSALGAGQRRLIGQLLTESGALAIVGGVLGICVAYVALQGILAFAPPELPRRETIALNSSVLLFALLVTAVAALISGLAPALLTAAAGPSKWLRGGGGAVPTSRSDHRLRAGLVVGQISLALVVLVGAGLLVRSLATLQTVDLGFREAGLLVMQTALPTEAVQDRSRHVAMQEEAFERLTAFPGIRSAAAVPARPFSEQGGWTAMYTAEGQPPEVQTTNPWVNFEVVGSDYFQTLGVSLLHGRGFTPQDREGALPVAVVSEAVAQHSWPGEDAIGRLVKLGPPDGPGQWHTVVGVVAETRYRDLVDPQPSLYLPIRQFAGPVPMGIAVRTASDPAEFIPQVRATLAEVHPGWLVTGGGPMGLLLAAPLARPRFTTGLLGAFATVTLLLAFVGIYGVLATTVRQRTPELAVRLALGAGEGEVRRLVLGRGLRLAMLGCLIGLLGALAGTRLLRDMLFEIHPTDPTTFIAAAVVVLVASALACYLPARRATRVDPMIALRAE